MKKKTCQYISHNWRKELGIYNIGYITLLYVKLGIIFSLAKTGN